jgi:hypothetical protein
MVMISTPNKAKTSSRTFSKTQNVAFRARESKARGSRSSSNENINTAVARYNEILSNINII